MDIEGEEFSDQKFSLGAEKQFGFYNIAEKKMEVVFRNKYENPKTLDFLKDMQDKAKDNNKEKN